MRILIIKTSSLGDIVHALPVIEAIHLADPGCEIDWIAEEQFMPLLEHHPRLAMIHRIRTKTWRRRKLSGETFREISALWKALRRRRYDLVFDLQGNLKSGLLCWSTGAGTRVGLAADALQEKINALFTNRRIPFLDRDRNVTERYLRIISTFFNCDDTAQNLSGRIVSAEADEAAAEKYLREVPGSPRFFFQVGTTWSTKLWHPEGWCFLAKRLKSRFPGSAILINWGSPQEKEVGERIIAESGSGVHLLPWFTIRELIPVIRRCDIVIGGDTGPVYLAAAVGTATVSYYRATSALTYAPRGERHAHVQASMSCAACGLTSCERDDECRSSISVDTLFDAVVALLDRQPERKDAPCSPE